MAGRNKKNDRKKRGTLITQDGNNKEEIPETTRRQTISYTSEGR